MAEHCMFQVSTLQALALGYSRSVIRVKELLQHGDTGLGTFEDVNGEMILADGICWRACDDGTIVRAGDDMGVPFSAVSFLREPRCFDIGRIQDIESLKSLLTVRIEENFGLNSMHMVRIDGTFEKVCARSESPYRSQHISLQEILDQTQKDFCFEHISGTLVCVYFPDYMDGINAPGWHLHFLSEDKSRGGHVFDAAMDHGTAQMNKISRIEICLPDTPAFDTYSLTQISQDTIRKTEQSPE